MAFTQPRTTTKTANSPPATAMLTMREVTKEDVEEERTSDRVDLHCRQSGELLVGSGWLTTCCRKLLGSRASCIQQEFNSPHRAYRPLSNTTQIQTDR